MRIKLSIAVLVLLGCSVNLEMRVGRQAQLPDSTHISVDTVMQAVIIMTKKDSVAAWDGYVQDIKEALWLSACKTMKRQFLESTDAIPVEWSGDFRSKITLEAVAWHEYEYNMHLEERTFFFTWYFEPVKGIWLSEDDI